MQHFLIATDFSDASVAAAEYAVDLACALGADVTLFTALEPLPPIPEMNVYQSPDYMRRRKKEVKRNLHELASRLGKKCMSEIKERIGMGQAAPEILRAMKDLKPDVTAMGSRGAGMLERTVFGSVALAVVKKADRPVLVIPEDAIIRGLKTFVYASDYLDGDPERVGWLSHIAEKLDAEIRVIHVAEGELKEEVEADYLGDMEIETKGQVLYKKLKFQLLHGKHVASAIEDYVTENRVDMLALCMEKRSALLKIILPSTTKKLVFHAKTPLLIFPSAAAVDE